MPHAAEPVRRAPVVLALLLVLAAPTSAAGPVPLPESFLHALEARPLGPANMGGRITALGVVPGRPSTVYVAAASGGLWKTVNNGITWAPVFDGQTAASVGDVAVAPSRPETIWVGTGEANARNSVAWGDGVYRSTDGGRSWKNVGLRDTHHVGRVAVHPRDPDVAYVAALGHLWGSNRERGLFRTRDGGATWKHVLALDQETGCVDVALDPVDPDTVYAAAYRVRRDAFAGGTPPVQFGPRAGLYKSADGGESWKRLTRGLPDRPLGRCGLAVAAGDPRVVYAVVQTDRTDLSVTAGQPARSGGRAETGGVFRSDDRGETWAKVNDLCPRPFYYGQVRVDPRDARRVYVLGVSLFGSDDGGRTFGTGGSAGTHSDHHALWIDPNDADHLALGTDGGLFVTYDRGAAWEHVNNLPLAQCYAAGVDFRRPYRVYGGLQDNGTWCGPSRTHHPEGITAADWFRVLGGDGFACRPDPADPDTVYAEVQYGGLYRLNVRTGAQLAVRPRPPPGAPAYRFNWSAPLLLSPHGPRVVYFGGNHLFRSADRGGHWDVVSPDLTSGRPGPDRSTGHTLTALAESPLRAGLLYAGSDDGRVHVSRDGGGTWEDVGGGLPGVAPDGWVTRVECSPFAEGTAYLSLDRHRRDDRAPYLFRTTDFGATWVSVRGDLPGGAPVHVVRADPGNRELLYAGTERGLWASADGGRHWHPLGRGLPPAAVHDLVVHPRERELVVATHGRGLFVVDVAPLQQATARALAAPLTLFEVKPAGAFRPHGTRGTGRGKHFLAPNPPYGASVYFWLGEPPPEPARVTVTDALGNPVAELKGGAGPGLQRVVWDLRGPGDTPAPPGEYVVRVRAGGLTRARPFRVEAEE